MPDFFDRLLARSVPAAQTGGASPDAGTVRLRPRLPGPFERIEAVRAEPRFLHEPAPQPATDHHPPRALREVVREREVRTDHHTVLRAAEPAPSHPEPPRTVPAPFADRRPTSPLLRPAVQPPPGPREALEGKDAKRSERHATPAFDDLTRSRAAPSLAAPVGAGIASASAVAAVRPRAVDTAAARNAARSGIGRRQQQPAERVVHVQIGRLEVSASPAGGRDSRNAAAPGRRAPALALDAFLSREGKRS